MPSKPPDSKHRGAVRAQEVDYKWFGEEEFV
jgi:hypothetical protein